MALEGSIRDFSLADIFQLIGIQRKTGVLTLTHGEEEVKVSFLNGMVVNADSKTKRLDDRLGSVLVKTGKLSLEDLKKALKLQRETLKKVGHLLVEEKMVRPEDLREALGIQITQIIYRLFRWKDGDYHFEQDVNVDYDKENFTPMSAESILMEGMRMIDEWPIIERKIPSFDMVFERVPLGDGEEPIVEEGSAEEEVPRKDDDFDLIFGGEKKKAGAAEPSKKIKLTRDENSVYQQVTGKTSVQEVIDRTMLSEFEICRALYNLTNRNLIQPVVSTKAKVEGGATKKGVEVAAYAAKLLRVGIAGWVVAAGLLLSRRNPLNLLVPPPLGGPQVQLLRSDVAAAKLRRMAAAVDTFVLVNRGYPVGPQDLLKDGILGSDDLLDPWGRPMGLELKEDRVVVSCHNGPGDDSPLLTEDRPRRTSF